MTHSNTHTTLSLGISPTQRGGAKMGLTASLSGLPGGGGAGYQGGGAGYQAERSGYKADGYNRRLGNAPRGPRLVFKDDDDDDDDD